MKLMILVGITVSVVWFDYRIYTHMVFGLGLVSSFRFIWCGLIYWLDYDHDSYVYTWTNATMY